MTYRYYQAAELLAGPAETELPVIILGDFNAEPETANDSAWLLINHGFEDTWTAVYPGQPGYTCCYQSDLIDDGTALTKQIDLILFRGDFHAISAEVVESKTSTGLWSSDHAGLVATLLVPEDND
jgi:endonuclease/exonuclease/phosphatase family metal-dependent hydrolase